MQITDKLMKPLTEVKYLNADNVSRYRCIMRIFFDNYEKLRYWLYQEDVFEELKKDPHFEDYRMEQCQQDLAMLTEWKNLNTIQDTRKVASIEEFKNKKFRYQMSEYSVEIERLVVRLENLFVESLQKANVLKLNEDELPLLISLLSLSTDFVEAIAELIARFSLKYVIFTQGAVRSGIYDASGEVSSINTPKVEVADTVGAGDSFTATFVVNILRGASVAESHRKAVDVSAYTCTQRGAINPLPDSKK